MRGPRWATKEQSLKHRVFQLEQERDRRNADTLILAKFKDRERTELEACKEDLAEARKIAEEMHSDIVDYWHKNVDPNKKVIPLPWTVGKERHGNQA